MPFRIASVSFLNALPLVDWLSGRPAEEATLVADLPSRLPEYLHDDLADVALLPVVESFRGRCAEIVPGIGLASRGAVDSVKLFARTEPRDLSRVLVDRGSRTSVALLRILLAELYDVRPDFHAVEPRPENVFGEDGDAALVIGDRCFAAEGRLRASGADVAVLDLGEAWMQMTGLPFVFAVWGLGAPFAGRASAREKAALAALLARSRDEGLARVDALAEREAAAGRLGPGGERSADALRRYFRRSMHYELGPDEMAGLARFHELCVRHSVCPEGRPPRVAALCQGE